MKNTTERDCKCPWCGRLNTLASGANVEGPPTEGAVSLCWKCHYPAMFTADGSLRKPTHAEYDSIMSDPDVKHVLYSMKESTRPAEALAMYEAFDAQRRKDPDGKH